MFGNVLIVHAKGTDVKEEPMLNKWLENDPKETLICAVASVISLALTSADAGIAMGGIGSDIAIESADAVLVSDEIKRLPYLFSLMQKVMKKVQVNIIASLVINLSAVVLSALGVLNPLTGELWHNCGSVFVVVNAALLLRLKDTDSGN